MSYRERENRKALAAEASLVFAGLCEAIGELQVYRLLAPRMMADLPEEHPEWSPLDVLRLEEQIQLTLADLEARVAAYHEHPLADQLRALAEAFVAVG